VGGQPTAATTTTSTGGCCGSAASARPSPNAAGPTAPAAGVWAILVTAPTSMLFFFAGPAGLIGIPIGAIVQATALGALYRYITERRARSIESGVSNA
ncbi:SCO4225 family membrane protein, partial [Streptomyces sp. NPDC001780]